MDSITGKLILKPGREKPVRNRHPWVFSGAIAQRVGTPTAGDLVEISDAHGRYLATALFNPNSQIQARILTWDPNTAVDTSFWQRRFQRAADARAALQLEPNTNAYRLVSAEADGLPGLIVDRYDDTLVMQCLTLGIDRRKQALADLLQEMFQPQAIIERSDVDVRRKEGLALEKGVLRGSAPAAPFLVQENGRHFQVDLLEGHKTGFYLDQRENRALVGNTAVVGGKSVLNVFAYTGGFAVYAAAAGASQIINIDSSIPALETAEANLTHNQFDRPQDEYIAGDAFEVLRYYRDNGTQFDVVILDPPKFVHSRRNIDRAARGYKDLNWLALRLLRPGGVLATFSCSGLVSAELFQKMVFGAAVDAGRDVQIMQSLQQGPDHPILLSFPESAYLKGLLCRVW